MQQAQQIMTFIHEYVAANATRTANILLGPKREVWFSSEFFVAINNHFDRSLYRGWIVYGEEAYKTIRVKLSGGQFDAGERPDLYGWHSNGTQDTNDGRVDFFLELKLALSDDVNIADQIRKLKNQVDLAKNVFPNATAIALVVAAVRANHMAHAAHPKGFFDKVGDIMDTEMPQTSYPWIQSTRMPTVNGFVRVNTSMSYPQCAVSCGIGGKVKAS